jgi:hypothetical protein
MPLAAYASSNGISIGLPMVLTITCVVVAIQPEPMPVTSLPPLAIAPASPASPDPAAPGRQACHALVDRLASPRWTLRFAADEGCLAEIAWAATLSQDGHVEWTGYAPFQASPEQVAQLRALPASDCDEDLDGPGTTLWALDPGADEPYTSGGTPPPLPHSRYTRELDNWLRDVLDHHAAQRLAELGPIRIDVRSRTPYAPGVGRADVRYQLEVADRTLVVRVGKRVALADERNDVYWLRLAEAALALPARSAARPGDYARGTVTIAGRTIPIAFGADSRSHMDPFLSYLDSCIFAAAEEVER